MQALSSLGLNALIQQKKDDTRDIFSHVYVSVFSTIRRLSKGAEKDKTDEILRHVHDRCSV